MARRFTRSKGRFSRREALRVGVAGVLGAVMPGLFVRRAAAADYGPLVEDPDGLLDLPEGFTYRVLSRTGDEMTDGYLVPDLPDGMGLFEGPNGEWILMRNHELSGHGASGPYAAGQTPPPEAYDATQDGGVTRVVLDPSTLEPLSSNLVLVGTTRNCSGGVSPWGWLSCEETVNAGHGYVFLCDPLADRVQPYQRVDAYGRFYHEAVCIDPETLVAYLTEDRTDGALYRFLPRNPQVPHIGRLQAMAAVGSPGFDTGNAMAIGDSIAVEWVDIADPTPDSDTVRQQARDLGALKFTRGEGAWFFDGAAYFTATTGGPGGLGQVFRFDADPGGDRGALTLLAQATGDFDLYQPDNITVAPFGGVFFAEDAGAGSHVRGLDASGALFDVASSPTGELAGVCFSPDGGALFLNLWTAGITLVVTGPFASRFGDLRVRDAGGDAAPLPPGARDAAPDIPLGGGDAGWEEDASGGSGRAGIDARGELPGSGGDGLASGGDAGDRPGAAEARPTVVLGGGCDCSVGRHGEVDGARTGLVAGAALIAARRLSRR